MKWVICLFKKHDWSKWCNVWCSSFVMGKKVFQERICLRCDKIETRKQNAK